MNIRTILFTVILISGILPAKARAQEHEIEQLLLNVEKLAQFKEILQSMYDGYKILEEGYNKVRDIASGNFQLHKAFLDGLMQVSPEVQKYYKITEIITMQVRLVKEYRSTWSIFKQTNIFNPGELDHISRIYDNLIREGLRNLEALTLVITAGQLRMNDDERIRTIDQIHKEISDKLFFLRTFNSTTHELAIQKLHELSELQSLKKLHGIE